MKLLLTTNNIIKEIENTNRRVLPVSDFLPLFLEKEHKITKVFEMYE